MVLNFIKAEGLKTEWLKWKRPKAEELPLIQLSFSVLPAFSLLL
jgi:hypothetical protein